MLYELALPAFLIDGSLRWLCNIAGWPSVGPAFKLRAARSRLRRVEVAWLARVAPDLAAALVLRRFQDSRAPSGRHLSPQSQSAHAMPHRVGGLLLRCFGPVSGSRLLLLHGWNADGMMMQPLARALASLGFRVLVPDLPGAGGSARGARDFIQIAQHLVQACAALGPFETVIGHSAGGLIAAIATSEGLKAADMVTISAPASMAHLLALYLERTDAPKALLSAVLAAYHARSGRAPADIGAADYAVFSGRHLVAHARHDWQVPPEDAFLICAGQPGRSPLLLPDCNHRSILSHPALHAAIATFLSQPRVVREASC